MIIGKQIINYQEIGSTNDEAKRLVKKGQGEGLVVVAQEQTAGRGKPGSRWFSPAGSGCYLSAVVKPFKNPQDLGPITLLGARAVVGAIAELTGLQAVIKPPNDVLLRAKKISGVLVERLATGEVIIGIGVNVGNPAGSFPDDIKDSATSLLIESKKRFGLKEVSAILLARLDQEYLAYLNEI
ncbi:biotin--[acetyl-CoA-carboxylase] ligase [Candidatus Margulisiibacteriota bacterium]